jgi:hypothetical protein
MAIVPRDRKDIGLVTVWRPIMATPASGGYIHGPWRELLEGE